MIRLHSQKGKKIGIFGLNRTGMASYASLENIAEIICYDDNEKSRNDFAVAYPDAEMIEISNPEWQQLDIILLSPGVPLSHPIFKLAKLNNINIYSDISMLFTEYPMANYIAITGTNGKSTTTSLIAHILQLSGFNYPAGGNLGNAALSLPAGIDGYVLELSSFQLELIHNFRAKIGILLNITPDHLDRHLTMDNYINIKKKILSSEKKDSFNIISVDNDITNRIYQLDCNHNKTIPISALNIQDKGVAVLENSNISSDEAYIIHDNIFAKSIIKLPYLKSLQGTHNRENIAASYAACRVLELTPDQIVSAIGSFVGLSHRMEYIGSIKNIDIYNDSKATNADAASKSISALDNIYWIAGGVAKIGGIDELAPLFHKITKAYLFGQDKQLFAESLAGKVQVKLCNDLEEATENAFSDALTDKTSNKKNILLAPSASSYDQFANFEERGEKFKEFCKKYLDKI